MRDRAVCRRAMTLAVGALLAVLVPTMGQPRPPVSIDGHPIIGKWNVEFANGVREEVVIKSDGSSTVVEPLRSSPGKAERDGTAVVIRSDDDRIERWTQVGRRMIVEHWFPASQFPSGTPVMGIADRAP